MRGTSHHSLYRFTHNQCCTSGSTPIRDTQHHSLRGTIFVHMEATALGAVAWCVLTRAGIRSTYLCTVATPYCDMCRIQSSPTTRGKIATHCTASLFCTSKLQPLALPPASSSGELESSWSLYPRRTHPCTTPPAVPEEWTKYKIDFSHQKSACKWSVNPPDGAIHILLSSSHHFSGSDCTIETHHTIDERCQGSATQRSVSISSNKPSFERSIGRQ